MNMTFEVLLPLLKKENTSTHIFRAYWTNWWHERIQD